MAAGTGLRHTVEPIIESFVPVPMVDVPVPQRVDQSAEVVKFFVTLPVVAEQVVEVPTIILGDTIPQRAPLRAPQLAEQLVEVPLPAWMRLALGTDVEAVHGGLLVSGGLQAYPVDPPRGLHRQPRAVYKYWARLRRLHLRSSL